MKTNTKSRRLAELLVRSGQRSENSNSPEQPPAAATAQQQTPAPEAPSSQLPAPSSDLPSPNSLKTVRPYVNFKERDANRALSTERVLAVLKRWMPRQYELAEVVGKWVWITFAEPPAERIRADLSQLGFHWNNTRKCWQHPCGETLPRGEQNPREKYTTYHPADQVPA